MNAVTMPRSISRNAPIDLDLAARYAPSILAPHEHSSRSERYAYVPTVDVLKGLEREGFKLFAAMQARTRDDSRRGFTKHMLRLRRADQVMVGDSFPEIVLINSHDGTSSFQLKGGIFRLVCSNGMVVGDTFADVRIHHKGNVVDSVIEGAYSVVSAFDRIGETTKEMKAITLSPAEREVFAEAAIPLRFDTETPPVSSRQVLQPRRYGDNGSDLWTTFNVLQENLVRGGVHFRQRGSNGRMRHGTTREVAGIDGNVKLNQALFTLAEGMARLKAAA